MKILCLIFVAIAAASEAANLESLYTADELAAIDPSILEDARLDFEGLTRKYGYPVETHYLTTRDGYILELHRIPHGKNCPATNTTKIPVLLQHGLLSHSIDWIIMGPNLGLGYILADECFDVWLGNARGTRESRKHVSMSEGDPKYWDFSWHELGVEDLPAIVDHILNTTGQSRLHYVGHSQGTTQFFAFASLRPEYSHKIRSAHMLSPVAYMKRIQSPLIRFLQVINKPFFGVIEMIGMKELLSTSDLIRFLGSEICKEKYPILKQLCVNVLFLLCGFDHEQTNTTMIPVIAGHTPAGGSVKQLLHYLQLIQTGEFRLFDYGFIGNQQRYQSFVPPKYPLENIKSPVAFYFGDNDYLSQVDDMHMLADAMPNLIGKFRAPWKKFNHLDFIWAIDVRKMVFDRLICIMKRY